MVGKIIHLEPYKDPDEFIKNLGAEEFQKRIDEAENSFFFEIRVLEREFDLKDPDSKTRFYREVAKKLCSFSEEVERENYIQAIAEKYNIGFDNLRKLVTSYAAKTGLVKPIEKPKSGIKTKNVPEEAAKKNQRLLITWITDNPQLYKNVKKYISSNDFTEDLYRQVAEKLFADIENDAYNPAAIISMFADEEQQRQVAELFSTTLNGLETQAEREKAFKDILVAVKKNSYEHYSLKLGSDINALQQVIEGKKALEELQKTHILLNER